MINIRQSQIEVFEEIASQQFEDEMVIHSKEFSPILCKVIGDEQLRLAIKYAIRNAEFHGFTLRGTIRLYIELMFLFGSNFDSDPQYNKLSEILNADNDQMDRAEQIYEITVDYHAKVSGQDNINTYNALELLLSLIKKPMIFEHDYFTKGMLQEITYLFPEKAAYIGEEYLIALINEASDEATRHHFSTIREKTMMVILMFAFGHGCTNDLLYPWIYRTLQDEKIKDPANRANRLEKKAITWLEHVLPNHQKGTYV